MLPWAIRGPILLLFIVASENPCEGVAGRILMGARFPPRATGKLTHDSGGRPRNHYTGQGAFRATSRQSIWQSVRRIFNVLIDVEIK
jgi:hypothetical protein